MRQPDSDSQLLHEIAARVLPGTSSLTVTRTATGGSTPVYRIQSGTITLYLRLAESPEANLAPEVFVHQTLRARGVRIPEIVHFEPFNEELGRSLMVTTEIVGQPIAERYHKMNAESVLISAGRDLALINGLPVAGFGWILRDRSEPDALAAELPTLRAFALEDLELHLANVSNFLGEAELRAIHHTISQRHVDLNRDQAVLVHGDFDTSHIYHLDGRYTGIIDFGEIRGADPFYDLGHFNLHDRERVPSSLLGHLLTGYGEVISLPSDVAQRINRWSVLIGIRALAMATNQPSSSYHGHLVGAIKRALTELRAHPS